ncbi:MAG: hypothetical protein JJT87_19575 [Halomonas sp.]|nr:hypothetical protein [Halomonas sp.]MCC5904118.1 hypothetical protein [Halomonas sp.]
MSLINLLDRPIAFNRTFVDLGVGITGALMLSQCVYWSTRTKDDEGWFYKTQAEWTDETGMTRREQETARKKLVNKGYIKEVRRGVPCKTYYRLDREALEADLLQVAQKRHSSMAESANQECTKAPTSMAESAKQACTNPPDSDGGMRPTITEITTETTAESTQVAPGASPGATEGDYLGAVEPKSSAAGANESADDLLARIPSDMPGTRDPNAKTFKPWANYACAYRARYGTWPVWNQKAGSNMSQLVDRVGAERAPGVAAHYVKLNNQYYTARMHPVGLLLQDCEAIATQLVTGQQVTQTRARQLDSTQSNLSNAEEAKRIMAARRQQQESSSC